jgi:hypothetical protein
VALAVWDPTTAADNAGGLTVRIIANTPTAEMTWQVPATAAAGVSSPGALEAGVPHLVTVSGTVDAGAGQTSDAECSATPADPTWRWTRSLDPAQPTADHLDLLLDRKDQTFTAVDDSDEDGCDTVSHTYRRTVTLDETRPINLRVDDPAWQDNAGELTVHVERVDPATGPETVVVDSTRPAVETTRNYLAGQALRVTATGTYTHAPGVTADAECAATSASPSSWLKNRAELRVDGTYYGDVLVDGSGNWLTADGAPCDGTTHTYVMTYTPTRTGPLRLGVHDLNLADNAGQVTVTVTPAAG